MLEICIQTSYDKNAQLIVKSYLPVVYGTPLITHLVSSNFFFMIGPYKNITKPHYVLELTLHSHL
jgi:hypothetical protein